MAQINIRWTFKWNHYMLNKYFFKLKCVKNPLCWEKPWCEFICFPFHESRLREIKSIRKLILFLLIFRSHKEGYWGTVFNSWKPKQGKLVWDNFDLWNSKKERFKRLIKSFRKTEFQTKKFHWNILRRRKMKEYSIKFEWNVFVDGLNGRSPSIWLRMKQSWHSYTTRCKRPLIWLFRAKYVRFDIPMLRSVNKASWT